VSEVNEESMSTTLEMLAEAIDDRSPVVFMPRVADFIRHIASIIDDYEKDKNNDSSSNEV
jgi:hypothetical protein